MPFTDFPWFRQATIDQLLNVERPTPTIYTGRSSMSTFRFHRFAIRRGFPLSRGSVASLKAPDYRAHRDLSNRDSWYEAAGPPR